MPRTAQLPEKPRFYPFGMPSGRSKRSPCASETIAVMVRAFSKYSMDLVYLESKVAD